MSSHPTAPLKATGRFRLNSQALRIPVCQNFLTLETGREKLSTRTTPRAPASQCPKLHIPTWIAGARTRRQLSGAKVLAGTRTWKCGNPTGGTAPGPHSGETSGPGSPAASGAAHGERSATGLRALPCSLLPPPAALPRRGLSPHSSKVVSPLLPSLKLTKPDFYSQHWQLPVNLHWNFILLSEPPLAKGQCNIPVVLGAQIPLLKVKKYICPVERDLGLHQADFSSAQKVISISDIQRWPQKWHLLHLRASVRIRRLVSLGLRRETKQNHVWGIRNLLLNHKPISTTPPPPCPLVKMSLNQVRSSTCEGPNGRGGTSHYVFTWSRALLRRTQEGTSRGRSPDLCRDFRSRAWDLVAACSEVAHFNALCPSSSCRKGTKQNKTQTKKTKQNTEFKNSS